METDGRPGASYDCGFIVIDFEAVTPRGRPAEPIEVAALALRQGPDGWWTRGPSFSSLIRPPADTPFPDYSTRITGITPEMVAGAPEAGEVLGALDARLGNPPYRLVAHGAVTEASLIARQRAHCPLLASTPLIDTLAMANKVAPELPAHRLDDVLDFYRVPRPKDRHRALADVLVTAEIFTRLLEDGEKRGWWSCLATLDRAAGRNAAHRPAPGQLTLGLPDAEG